MGSLMASYLIRFQTAMSSGLGQRNSNPHSRSMPGLRVYLCLVLLPDRISVGHMRLQFLTSTGLRRSALLSEVTNGHIVSLDFLIDQFGSSGSCAAYRDNFATSEERRRVARVDALLMHVISFLYMPVYMDHLDVTVVMMVRALYDDHTILPLILAKIYISASYYHAFGDKEFRGSFVLLYVWFMIHLSPIRSFHRHNFYFGHSIAMRYSFRPFSYMDATSWTEFLSSIKELFSILIYFGYCYFLSFLTHATYLDFIPLAGLRGVTTYHPLAVMGQFDQLQDLHSFTDAADYRFPILSSTEAMLARVYGLWGHRESAAFRDSYPDQTFKYLSWLDTDLGVVTEGPIEGDDGSSGEESMEDPNDDPVELTKDELFMGLTEALARDVTLTVPTFMAASRSELECRV